MKLGDLRKKMKELAILSDDAEVRIKFVECKRYYTKSEKPLKEISVASEKDDDNNTHWKVMLD